MTLRTLNYENYSIFLIMGNAGFCPSTVVLVIVQAPKVTGLPLWLVDFHLFGFAGLRGDTSKRTGAGPPSPQQCSSTLRLMDKILHYPL